MEKIIIRSAVLEDLTILKAFEQGIIKAERPYDETLRPDPISYYDIGAMIQSENCSVIVANIGSEIVGSAYARIEKSKAYLNHTQNAYLGFMFVPKEHRGKGINKMIIDALAEWARSKGISELRLDVYDENQSAIRAYEKAGFKKYIVNMRMDIS